MGSLTAADRALIALAASLASFCEARADHRADRLEHLEARSAYAAALAAALREVGLDPHGIEVAQA